jgi:hypothetical protein
VKPTRAAMFRRRRLTVSVTAATLVTAGVLLATELPAHSHSGSPSTPDKSAQPGAVSAPLASQGSSFKAAVRSYIAKRDGAISLAMYDNVAKTLTIVHPSVRGRTASVVKVDILETRLHQTRGHLSSEEREVATAMIENSDNDSASDLFNADGGAPGLEGYNDDLDLEQTVPNDEWGLTTTSAADQLILVRTLLHHNEFLTNSARRFQRGLMRHVEADQRWGIGAGVPTTAYFGNKNGWLPVDEDHDRWAVNSVGWVRGDGKAYEIAVITQHSVSFGYGKRTINHLSALAWNAAAPATP